MKRILFLIALCAYMHDGRAQKFVAEAALPAVTKDGFYRIPLSPDLVPYLTTQFSNVRIFNDKQEVPYLFQEEPAYYYSEQFVPYKILEKKSVKNCCTTLVLHNPEHSAISNISLQIKNADVIKRATLLGSDDRKQWYALRQQVDLSAINNQNNTAELKLLDFPLSNYTYFSIRLNDSTTAPLNILSAGYYKGSTEDGQYTDVRVATKSKTDSTRQKQSFIRLVFNSPQVVDRLQLVMGGMPFFHRSATVYALEERQVKRGKKIRTEKYYRHVLDFDVRSAQPAEVTLDGVKSSELRIIIENNDNPPLTLTSANVSQRNRYLTAWLEAGKSYVLKMGDENMNVPVYDLAFFKDSIPAMPQVIQAAAVKPMASPAKPPAADTFFTNTAIIWIAIIAVIGILGILSVRLIREAAKKQPE